MIPERNPVFPLIDKQEADSIYDRSIHRMTLLGALVGAVVLGWLGYAVAAGGLPVAGFGQWAGAGPGLGAFAGGGIGVAAGGLLGALIALFRLPHRQLAAPDPEEQDAGGCRNTP